MLGRSLEFDLTQTGLSTHNVQSLCTWLFPMPQRSRSKQNISKVVFYARQLHHKSAVYRMYIECITRNRTIFNELRAIPCVSPSAASQILPSLVLRYSAPWCSVASVCQPQLFALPPSQGECAQPLICSPWEIHCQLLNFRAPKSNLQFHLVCTTDFAMWALAGFQ